MSSPYPGTPGPPEQPGGSAPGGGPPQDGSSWGGPPPPDASSAPQGGAPPERKKAWPWIVGVCGCLVLLLVLAAGIGADRKSTRLNSSHVAISYAVFCLKK